MMYLFQILPLFVLSYASLFVYNPVDTPSHLVLDPSPTLPVFTTAPIQARATGKPKRPIPAARVRPPPYSLTSLRPPTQSIRLHNPPAASLRPPPFREKRRTSTGRTTKVSSTKNTMPTGKETKKPSATKNMSTTAKPTTTKKVSVTRKPSQSTKTKKPSTTKVVAAEETSPTSTKTPKHEKRMGLFEGLVHARQVAAAQEVQKAKESRKALKIAVQTEAPNKDEERKGKTAKKSMMGSFFWPTRTSPLRHRTGAVKPTVTVKEDAASAASGGSKTRGGWNGKGQVKRKSSTSKSKPSESTKRPKLTEESSSSEPTSPSKPKKVHKPVQPPKLAFKVRSKSPPPKKIKPTPSKEPSEEPSKAHSPTKAKASRSKSSNAHMFFPFGPPPQRRPSSMKVEPDTQR
ncbi:hypothetical protein P280DRAFT_109748 [Massarina eburnea CBS 473.64]|uniref:TPX2 C-terminal domain-containing protein n=1 Tax=Massarina eburnea CBS 473.64 TaxID=1395130 RepID=A0A6A6RSJ3_9PLEO|nr:hypothetical protein P280DRAFT_109748 [Massarina eburnea CBS 473.64]